VRSGPTCVRQLGDWGAKVIKIETPEAVEPGQGVGGPRHGFDFQNLHRNKRSLTLNLKHPDGLTVLHRLVGGADVLVENYRPEVKHRLGIDYEALKPHNPRLVYASISGFGQDGPYRLRPGFDQVAQGMGGLMSVTGLPGQGPVRAGIPVADLSAGLTCAIGILIALLERQTSGEGQWVSASLLEAQVSMLDFQAARWLMAGEVAGQAGNDHPTSIPTGVFPTSDGYVNIAASGQTMWRRFCEVLGRPELAEHPDYANGELRSKNRKALNATFSEITKQQTSRELVDKLNAAGVPCGPINTIDDVFADPQVKHSGIATPVHSQVLGDIHVVGQPVHLSRTPSEIHSAAPERGEHTDEILREFGYDDGEIAAFHEQGVV
jgi:crotonobetainyl-CoA:carnitine CoA-transferase CaiB-like acyl-CoA transferase